ncbi:hypothetical protein [Aliamphritea spongicola]|uniref:hypothetical protein n=1 Tax=Aliamphritea spongicola TaxID=707589 RepID=UPI00196B59B9|nr:hypothetical protein [Aliamphritea spongicola]MBN3560745.1 hypothetical protein [Aliamphritea spongicola]
MSKYLFMSWALIVLFSSSAYSEPTKPGTYNNLEAEKSGKVGELRLHPVKDNYFLFSLKLNRGKPSYNSGNLYGELKFKNNIGVYESAEYKFKDKICTLKFENKGDLISIVTVNFNKQCGFGFGVYADGIYQLTSEKVPENYVDILGNTVNFP